MADAITIDFGWRGRPDGGRESVTVDPVRAWADLRRLLVEARAEDWTTWPQLAAVEAYVRGRGGDGFLTFDDFAHFISAVGRAAAAPPETVEAAVAEVFPSRRDQLDCMYDALDASPHDPEPLP